MKKLIHFFITLALGFAAGFVLRSLADPRRYEKEEFDSVGDFDLEDYFTEDYISESNK